MSVNGFNVEMLIFPTINLFIQCQMMMNPCTYTLLDVVPLFLE